MTTSAATKLQIHVDFQQDPDTDSPLENDVFKLITLKSCGGGLPGKALNSMPAGMQGKTWWIVSCYRHSGEYWFLQGDKPAGADRWDTTEFAGLLYLESGDPAELGPDPQKVAENMLEAYNLYCAGDCWFYRITYEEEVENEGVCPCCNTEGKWITRIDRDYTAAGGMIGLESALDTLAWDFIAFKQQFPNSPVEFEVALECDSSAQVCLDDIQEKIWKAGFQFTGDLK